jgi:hypothetical protein
MAISDETLIAYLDNELAAEERARVEAALAGDSSLRTRLREQEAVLDALHAAFGPVVNEPLPARLTQTAMTAPVSWRWRLHERLSHISLGAQARGERSFARLAMAATLLFAGVAIGLLVAGGPVGPNGDTATFAMAQGPLAHALEHQLAANAPAQGPRVGVSFSTKAGQLCRTFDLGAAQANKAGLACRGDSGWRLETLVAAEPRKASSYETVASAMPSAVSDAVKDLIAGEPLDAEGERKARARGWRGR